MYPKFYLFGIQFSSYKTMIAISISIGLVLSVIMLRKRGFKVKQILIVFILCIVSFFIGARLLNVLLNMPDYMLDTGRIYGFWFGGFSVVGGAIAGCITAVIVLRAMKLDVYSFLDGLTLPFLFCFPILKIGCFLNGCCYGKPTTSIFGVIFPQKNANPISSLLKTLSNLMNLTEKVYPTQLFESGLVLIVAIVIALLIRRRKFKKGELFTIGAIGFCLARLSVHFFRDFPYPYYVTNFVYPAFYVVIIVVLIINYRRINVKI